MKKLAHYILLGGAVMLSACSNVDENERYEYVKPADVERCVLLEDFTGQKCLNCPLAADEIFAIGETYGHDAVIAVGIHGGPLAVANSAKFTGLKTDEGDAYYYAFCGNRPNPLGLVDRLGEPSEYTTWQARVQKRIGQVAHLSLEVADTYDAENKTVAIKTIVKGTDGNSTGKLQLWVIEDGITAPQVMPDGKSNMEYEHNHVLRAAVNGLWGEDISVVEGETKEIDATFTLKTDWKPENCSIVAFVYNDSGVLQVTKAPVTTAPSPVVR